MKTYVPSIRALALVLSATITLSNAVRAQSSMEFILNGGFETGNLIDWSGPVPNPNPWVASAVLAHTGNYSAYNPALGTALGAPTLYQNFSPTPVSGVTSAGFWYYHPFGASGSVGLASELFFSDGTEVQDTLFANDPSYQVNVWSYRDLLPTLSAYSNKQLTGIGFPPMAGGNQYVDDVSIVGIAVPEPSTAILGCFGLLVTVCTFCVGHLVANKHMQPDPAITPSFHAERHQRGAADVQRSAACLFNLENIQRSTRKET